MIKHNYFFCCIYHLEIDSCIVNTFIFCKLNGLYVCLGSSIALKEPKPIDWEYYKKGIGENLVNVYKQGYESMFLPFSYIIYPLFLNFHCFWT